VVIAAEPGIVGPLVADRATGTAPARASIVNLGCKVNQAEIEAAARLLRERGTVLVGERDAADLVVVNTCTVTAVADQKSRQAVRRARRASPDATVVVTGCSVTVDGPAFAALDPAARLVDNDGKAALLAELAALAPRERSRGGLAGPLPTLSGVEIDGIADDRTAADRTRAFVKVQDGCSFHCTYCLIPAARGAERSLPPDAVLADVGRALAAGHREVVLTGINIGTYDGGRSEPGPRGSHLDPALTLAGLVRRILGETSVERVRLSSIEPQHVDDELLAAWRDGAGRTLPHFHLPLQSGDDGVLRRMGRRYDRAGYAAVVARIRSAIPTAAIHADVIVGFPTEDDAAFDRSRAFIDGLGFAGLHVFRYSSRPGTPATRMAGHVPEPIRRERAGALLALAAEARARFAAGRVGSVASVLLETRLADGRWLGHAEDHVPVAVPAPVGARPDNGIARVAVERVDAETADRVTGRVLAFDPGRRLRVPLPLAGAAPVAHHGGPHG
jgi:threonylcarbamoyladenosine tRNA methylthiotransferase MtaB